MADINPDDIPFVPDTSVNLIDTSIDKTTGKPGGKPTQAFHDWMMSLYDFTKRSIVDLTTKITTLIFDVEGVQAEIVNEATIRQTQDGILASQINTVAAGVGNATANGQIYFQAMAGPAGSVAAYGIFLTAGNVFTGLMLVAYSGGVSKIVMTSGSLEFYDVSSGSQINVLSYSAGEWLLNGNVTIQSANGAGSFRFANGNLMIRDAFGNPVFAAGINI